jgi:hypothetical protein
VGSRKPAGGQRGKEERGVQRGGGLHQHPLPSRASPSPWLASTSQATASHSNIYPCFIFQRENEENAIERERERERERRKILSFSFES